MFKGSLKITVVAGSAVTRLKGVRGKKQV